MIVTRKLKKLSRQINEKITERKQIEEALRESEAQYRALFEGSPDAIFLADPESGIILDANPAACRLLARPYEKIVGLHQSKIHPSHRESYSRTIFNQHVTEAMEQKGLHPSEMVVLRPDGTEVPVEVLAQLVTIKRKKVLQGVFRDITERREAEQAMRGSEERLRQAVRVSQIGIYDHDHITDTIYWSPQQREIYGWGPHEIVTLQAFLDRVYPEDRERIALAVRRAHDPSGDGLFDVEHRIIRRDGAIRCLTTRSQTFFDGEGGARHPVRTIGAVRDITENKRAEEEREKLQAQLTQAQKMESVGRLAGGVAHDFNNMLSAILGHAELALHKLDKTSPLQADLRKIRIAAQRSADLTRQLLAFARRQTIAPKVLDLNETVEGMLKMLHCLIGEDIDVAWLPGGGLWTVKIDPVQVDQIMANLLLNARDAITDKGKVTIETENVALDEVYCAGHPGFVPGRFVMLAVSDDGCGMDREILAHLYEPFFTTKGVGQGTGLGLATVYGIVKQNSGFINVYSEPGKGTIFKIYLPCYAIKNVPAVTEEQAQAPEGGTETILLVEDEPMILDLSKDLLEELGYTVLAARTPGEAIRLAEEYAGEIQLLMTDVIMPEMNGWDLAKRLLSLYPDLRSLFMSGYTARIISKRGALEEDVHFMQKPFSMSVLSAKVRDALERDR
ncbi:MAG TPA: PAS domain S-box protein [Nitrospirota bacterium]|nr:PAS domain S-box protein [Nitrospirota bacterium]